MKINNNDDGAAGACVDNVTTGLNITRKDNWLSAVDILKSLCAVSYNRRESLRRCIEKVVILFYPNTNSAETSRRNRRVLTYLFEKMVVCRKLEFIRTYKMVIDAPKMLNCLKARNDLHAFLVVWLLKFSCFWKMNGSEWSAIVFCSVEIFLIGNQCFDRLSRNLPFYCLFYDTKKSNWNKTSERNSP